MNAVDIKSSLEDIQEALRYLDHIAGHIGEREFVRKRLMRVRERLLFSITKEKDEK